MSRIAIATAVATTGHDADLQPLLEACAAAGLVAQVRAWDDQTVSWSRFDAVLLRSPWDYTTRLVECLQWCTQVSAQTRLLNPLPVVRWNTDKHYLLELAAQGVAVVPSTFVEPSMEPLPTLEAPGRFRDRRHLGGRVRGQARRRRRLLRCAALFARWNCASHRCSSTTRPAAPNA